MSRGSRFSWLRLSIIKSPGRPTSAGELRVRWRRLDRLAVCLWFLAAVGFGFSALGQYSDNRALIERGVQVRATVVDAAGPLERTQWLALRFTLPTGQVVLAPRVQDIRTDQRTDVGDQLDVVYDPDQPDRVVAAAATGPDPFALYLLGAFAVMFAIGGLAAWRQLRPRDGARGCDAFAG